MILFSKITQEQMIDIKLSHPINNDGIIKGNNYIIKFINNPYNNLIHILTILKNGAENYEEKIIKTIFTINN